MSMKLAVISLGIVTGFLLGMAAVIVLSLIPLYTADKNIPNSPFLPFSMNYSISANLTEGEISTFGRSSIENQFMKKNDSKVNITIESAKVISKGSSGRTILYSRATPEHILAVQGRIHPQDGCNQKCLKDFERQFKANLCSTPLAITA